ncbi:MULTISPECIES: DUF2524 family protein [Gracilibacillus]|uniref:DUF2524 domain-containing protein n=1 Tax=Gracilibacillus dipsosauri TaxID=178340 RepID=A0A317KXP9_9BACI|nr:DUF2524 family protein [Gracilibacillus dipsosauri]PWU68103.1 DUF2524 domain-containing protein [Gracilibacillus dipsosauri]
MTTRDSIENLLIEGQHIIQQAEEQLDMSNRNQFEMNEDYYNAQLELEKLAQGIERVLNSANAQQKEQLHRFQLIVNEKLNDMIMDQVDLTELDD